MQTSHNASEIAFVYFFYQQHGDYIPNIPAGTTGGGLVTSGTE